MAGQHWCSLCGVESQHVQCTFCSDESLQQTSQVGNSAGFCLLSRPRRPNAKKLASSDQADEAAKSSTKKKSNPKQQREEQHEEQEQVVLLVLLLGWQ